MSKEEIPPMRVSEWSGSVAPASQSLSPAREPLPESPSESPVPDAPEPEGGVLPVDPWRLIGGVWKRRRLVLIGLFAGMLLGLCFGLLRSKTRYQVSVQLIKRDLPSAFRVGETGEAFRPRQLSAGTLVGAAGADNVLERVAEKSSPKVSAGN
ncbi:MAG: hypothetical protein WCH43_00225 [Verrucomicrobiota bacterium]